MTGKKEKNRIFSNLDSSSKFWKEFLIILATFLTFAGPTYMVYVFRNIFKIDYSISMISGFGLFIIGLMLMWYLIKSKVVS